MTSRGRVALIAPHFAEYAALLSCALAPAWEVLLVLRADNAKNELGPEWPATFERAGVAVMLLETSGSISEVIASARGLVGAVRSFHPDVIHCQESLRDALILSLPFLRGVPRVLTVHDPEPHPGSDTRLFRLPKRRLYRTVIRRWPSAAITHGSYLADRLVAACPWLRGRVHSIPHGPLGDVTDNQQLPIGHRILFFGRIEEYKGLGIFIEAVTRLRGKGVPVTGVIAGQGDDLEKHRVRMENEGCFVVHDRYIPTEEVRVLFQDARVVALPYLEGTQSGVAAMALGFGRPVVASSVGAIPELVRHGENGLIVPPGDAAALALAIERVLRDDALAGRLASGACTLRDGALSWRTIADQTGALYSSLIRSSAGQSSFTS